MSYPQKNPGRLWHIWNTTRALMSTFGDKKTKRTAQTTAKQTGVAIGVIVAAKYASGIFLAGWFFSGAIWTVGLGFCAFFGWKAWSGIKELKKSSVVRDYMRQKKAAWQKKQGQPSFMDRIRNTIAKTARLVSGVIATTSLAIATAGGLQLAGVALPVVVAGAVAAMTSLASLPLIVGIGAAGTLFFGAATFICHKRVQNFSKPAAKTAAGKKAAPAPTAPAPKSLSTEDLMASWKSASTADGLTVEQKKPAAPKL